VEKYELRSLGVPENEQLLMYLFDIGFLLDLLYLLKERSYSLRRPVALSVRFDQYGCHLLKLIALQENKHNNFTCCFYSGIYKRGNQFASYQ
jgi:hypothetical protein